MTRINLIDPKELCSRHLIAERRELPMVHASLRRSLASKNGFRPDRIPKEFTLNSGHVMFFYPRLRFLAERYDQLTLEMIDRGFKPDLDRVLPTGYPNELYGDYHPTTEAVRIIRERIQFRINQKPHLYPDAKDRGWI